MHFVARLDAAQAAHQSALVICLAPRLEKIPYPMLRYDDNFLPFGKAIIDATAPYACAYLFDLAAYLSLGASGAIALERTIAYVPRPALTILHGPFTRPEYARMAAESAFNADAVTLETADAEIAAAFCVDEARGVLLHTDEATLLPVPLTTFMKQYPDQVGIYRSSGLDWMITFEGGRVLHAVGDSIIYASRGDDFADAAEAAARERRSQP